MSYGVTRQICYRLSLCKSLGMIYSSWLCVAHMHYEKNNSHFSLDVYMLKKSPSISLEAPGGDQKNGARPRLGNSWSILWILMTLCYSTRASVATVQTILCWPLTSADHIMFKHILATVWLSWISPLLNPNSEINSSPLDKMAAYWQKTFSDACSWLKKVCILIDISLKFIPRGPINNIT